MKRLNNDIVQFFRNQGYVIVSSIDKDGFPHSACKGIVKINQNGRIYLLDLYRAKTYENLKHNSYISITAIDEHKFIGYCLKGKAEIIPEGKIKSQIIKAWEDRITSRITHRILKNIHEEKGQPRHPEALLPKPEYLIVMEVKKIIDLTPHHLK
jgi:uncharacterized pyridoxamine 5'-phosphate oxidase family protein